MNPTLFAYTLQVIQHCTYGQPGENFYYVFYSEIITLLPVLRLNLTFTFNRFTVNSIIRKTRREKKFLFQPD